MLIESIQEYIDIIHSLTILFIIRPQKPRKRHAIKAVSKDRQLHSPHDPHTYDTVGVKLPGDVIVAPFDPLNGLERSSNQYDPGQD